MKKKSNFFFQGIHLSRISHLAAAKRENDMIQIENCAVSRLAQTDLTAPEFGKIPTDHMFIAYYRNGQWEEGKIIPFGNLLLSPFTLALHYAQSVFEGMKAFRTESGKAVVFRPEAHYNRLSASMERMCMPIMPKELFVNAVSAFVSLEKEWIPTVEGGALYLRPLVFASEARVGVKIADEYIFLIMACPSVPMYAKPLSVKVETSFSRAAEGGTGAAKCAGNYGAVFYPTLEAKHEGFDQVIWTDAKTHSFIEESGTMNVMLVKNGTLTTPPTSGTILQGITRDSLLTIAREMGVRVEERRISVDELKQGLKDGSITEVFGTGTAAVVIPINKIGIQNEQFNIGGSFDTMVKLNRKLSEIRNGSEPDTQGWNVFVN
jgi:branched-chain amino acid aminotransferase